MLLCYFKYFVGAVCLGLATFVLGNHHLDFIDLKMEGTAKLLQNLTLCGPCPALGVALIALRIREYGPPKTKVTPDTGSVQLLDS